MAQNNTEHLTHRMDFGGINGNGGSALPAPAPQTFQGCPSAQNVGSSERVVSAIAGGLLALYGVKRFSLGGLAVAGLGGALLYRGLSGKCQVYQALGINKVPQDTDDRVRHSLHDAIQVERTIEISKPVTEVYAFWRHLDNLPRFMGHLKSVKQITQKRSHWVAQAPAGLSVKWDAEIINEVENELIAWKSMPGSDVDNAGVLRFNSTADGGTRIDITLRYNPPAGRIGAQIAKLFGENPEQQLDADLTCFKRIMETGAPVSQDAIHTVE